jgi:hypothetical protein
MLADIILIALFGLGFGYWVNAQKAKEVALAVATRQCLASEVQMLDGFVALTGISLSRDETGKIRCQRRFLFEFSSTGYERYQCFVVMLGLRVQTVEMDAYRIQ